MSSTEQQKIRRRLSGYASNDNRIKRDYLKIFSLILLFIAIFAAFLLWLQPYIPIQNDTKNSITIKLSDIAEGNYKRIIWDEKPIIVYHRSSADIEQTNMMDWENMPDPQPSFARTHHPKWIVLLAQCQNLGCQPEFSGGNLVCGCDNSYYDNLGRVTRGRSQKNIPIVDWAFTADKQYIIIGGDLKNE